MSILATLRSWFKATSEINGPTEPIPCLYDKTYTHDPDIRLSEDPILAFDNLGEALRYFDLSAFHEHLDHFMNKEGVTLSYPDEKSKKPNGHFPLSVHIGCDQTKSTLLLSLIGVHTELHVVLKTSGAENGLQLDHVCIVNGEILYPVSCDKKDGVPGIIMDLAMAFRQTVPMIFNDPASEENDSELLFFKGLRPILKRLEDIEIQRFFVEQSTLSSTPCG